MKKMNFNSTRSWTQSIGFSFDCLEKCGYHIKASNSDGFGV
jgi:hypothetical protein